MNRPARSNLPGSTPSSRKRRALLWIALVALLLVAQTLLVALTVNYEASLAQDEAEAVAAESAAEIRHDLLAAMRSLQTLDWSASHAAAALVLRERRDLQRVEWRDSRMVVTDAFDTPYLPQLFSLLSRQELSLETEIACGAARRAATPMFSRSYFVPQQGGSGVEVIDLCVPQREAGRDAGFLVGSFAMSQVLEAATAGRQARAHEFSFVEGDGTRLARAGVRRGAGVYVAERVVDLPGITLQLRADGAAGRPSVIPNLSTALVLGLSIALFGVVLLLARDLRRRAAAEGALAEALAFRKAMEDSLSTGLRARDLQGVITYVNPAFCAMVGFSADELLTPPPRQARAAMPPYSPPYWPPEFEGDYLRRQRQRLEAPGRAFGDPREGYETVFMRKNGERFPVMIYEAPLVDGQGGHTGWMSAVLDISAQRRAEEVSRQQQDRLQASARLAMMGEMASLISHEINQPLAAIASYASGCLNLLTDPGSRIGAAGAGPLQGALERIAEQAERAGRVIASVQRFVRRRDQQHEVLPAESLFEAVLPLARMQARKSGARIEVDPTPPGAEPPQVRCDRTMVEQVLLNLARNGIQAMENAQPGERVLTLRVRQTQDRWVTFAVIDAGTGITPQVGAQLFTPFFTTRSEGMGLGLSLCRTVIEQHGGELDHAPGPGGRGTEFSFTLPAPAGAGSAPAEAAYPALPAHD